MGVQKASPTRRSGRKRHQTFKKAQWNKSGWGTKSLNEGNEEETEGNMETTASQSMETNVSAHITNRIEAVALQTSTAVVGEHQRLATTTPSLETTDWATSTTKTQVNVLTDLVRSLLKTMEEQRDGHMRHIETLQKSLSQEIEALQTRVVELTETIGLHLANTITHSNAVPSYADVARTPPSSQPSNVRTLTSMGTTPSKLNDTFYCTIDTSRVQEEQKNKANPGMIRKSIEDEIRTMDGHADWRCAAVIRDARNTDRIRISCRDEAELRRVKETAQKVVAAGSRVLRDQLYPVKVDNANRTAILDQEGHVRPGAAEALGKENEVEIAKIGWLSKKDTGKAYGSMVIYVTKSKEAERLLRDQYFHVAGESAYTRMFESRHGLQQCYNCQEIGHKAYACTKSQACAKCAQGGHHHSECRTITPKCVPCGGPHESFSRNCKALYPPRHE